MASELLVYEKTEMHVMTQSYGSNPAVSQLPELATKPTVQPMTDSTALQPVPVPPPPQSTPPTEGFGGWIQHFWITKTVVVRMVDLNPQPIRPDSSLDESGYEPPPPPTHKGWRIFGLVMLILFVGIPLILAFFGALSGLLYALWFCECCMQRVNQFERMILIMEFLVVPLFISGYTTFYLAYVVIACFVKCVGLNS